MQQVALLVAQPASWEALCKQFKGAGYSVTISSPDPEPLAQLLEHLDPDIILVELGKGLYSLHHLRRCLQERSGGKPVIVMALALPDHLNPAHMTVGLDDFILPPYHADEIMARVQLALWRTKRITAQQMISIGALRLDLMQRLVYLHEQALALAGREYDLLVFLASHRSQSFGRTALLRHVWGPWFDGDERVVDRSISRLRHALGDAHGVVVETVRGIGYRLNEAALLSDALRSVCSAQAETA